MATINFYRITEDSFTAVVGELRDGAPFIGFKLKPECKPDAAIAEFQEKLEGLGGILFVLQGGQLDLAKVHAVNANPELYTSFEIEGIDAEDFA
jgi:hypothetical protein